MYYSTIFIALLCQIFCSTESGLDIPPQIGEEGGNQTIDQDVQAETNDWYVNLVKRYVNYKYNTEITQETEDALKLVYAELKDNNDSLSIFTAISIAVTKGFTVLSIGDETEDKFIARGLLMIKGLSNYKFLRTITGNCDWTNRPELLAQLTKDAVETTLKFYTIKTRGQFINFYNINRILNENDDSNVLGRSNGDDSDLQEKLNVYYDITKLFDQVPKYGELLDDSCSNVDE